MFIDTVHQVDLENKAAWYTDGAATSAYIETKHFC
jgi:hypothetical protein